MEMGTPVLRLVCLVPCTRRLIIPSMCLQDQTNCFWANVRESFSPQRLLQEGKRPNGALICVPSRTTLHFLENAFVVLTGIGRFATTTGSNQQDCQPEPVKPLNQL